MPLARSTFQMAKTDAAPYAVAVAGERDGKRNGSNGSQTNTKDFTERRMRSSGSVFAMRISIGFIFAVTILMAVANAFICSKVLGGSYNATG